MLELLSVPHKPELQMLVDIALVAFVTTGLDYLVVDDYWLTKKELTDDLLLDATIGITEGSEIGCSAFQHGVNAWARYRHEVPIAAREDTPIAFATFNLIGNGARNETLRSLLANSSSEERRAVLNDVRKLWWLRLIQVTPAATVAPH